jgi:hypothetical protein
MTSEGRVNDALRPDEKLRDEVVLPEPVQRVVGEFFRLEGSSTVR